MLTQHTVVEGNTGRQLSLNPADQFDVQSVSERLKADSISGIGILILIPRMKRDFDANVISSTKTIKCKADVSK